MIDGKLRRAGTSEFPSSPLPAFHEGIHGTYVEVVVRRLGHNVGRHYDRSFGSGLSGLAVIAKSEKVEGIRAKKKMVGTAVPPLLPLPKWATALEMPDLGLTRRQSTPTIFKIMIKENVGLRSRHLFCCLTIHSNPIREPTPSFS